MPVNETILGGDAGNAGAIQQQTTEVKPEAGAAATPPAAAPAAFEYSRMVGADGALAENWREGLPEAIRGEKCLDSIKTIGALAQSYVHGQHAIGAGRVTVPTEKSTAEEWTAYYRAGGMPEKPEQYSVDGLKLPEGVTLDDTALAEFRTFAHQHGLSQKTFAAAVAYDAERAAKQRNAAAAAQQAEFEETGRKLRAEYGQRFSEVVAQCNRALQTFGLVEVFRNAGLLNNYDAIKALATMGGKISESRLPDTGTPVAETLQQQLAAITGNRQDAYYDREHPNHAARVAEVNRLLTQIANGGK